MKSANKCVPANHRHSTKQISGSSGLTARLTLKPSLG
jgi:hypothetical protein